MMWLMVPRNLKVPQHQLRQTTINSGGKKLSFKAVVHFITINKAQFAIRLLLQILLWAHTLILST